MGFYVEGDEDFPLPVKVIAKMTGLSMTKVRRNPEHPAVVGVLDACRRWEEVGDGTLLEWVDAPLPISGHSLTPAQVWRYGPDLDALLSDPQAEVARVLPKALAQVYGLDQPTQGGDV